MSLLVEIPPVTDCALICVAPEKLSEFWPHVENFLKRALEASVGEDTLEEIRDDLFADRALLWLVWDDERKTILAAATTKLVASKRGKTCIIAACAGQDLRRWAKFIEELEAFARAEGCEKMRVYGRAGWERLLSGYTKPWVTIEKDL